MAHAKGCLDIPNGLRWPTPMGGGLDYLGLGELIVELCRMSPVLGGHVMITLRNLA